MVQGIYSIVIYADDRSIIRVADWNPFSIYNWTTGWRTIESNVVINQIIKDSELNNQPWMIYDTVRKAHDWLLQQVNWSRPQVTVFFPEPYYNVLGSASATGIRLIYPTALWVVTHEYGHMVMYDQYGDLFPRITSKRVTNDSQESSPELAFVEGFADFIADAAYGVPANYDNIYSKVEEQTGADGRLGYGDYGDLDGQYIKSAVTNVLWDIYDGVDSNDYPSWDQHKYGDYVNSQLAYLWTILLNYHPQTIEEIWQYWEPKNMDSLTIFYHARMSFVLEPLASTDIIATPANNSVTLTWNKPIYLFAAAVMGDTSDVMDYLISYGTTPDSMLNQRSCDQLTCTLNNLTNGQTYYFKVTARNNIGWGFNSSVVSATPGPIITVPGTPNNLIVTPADGQVLLSWTIPDDDGGATIDQYVIFQDGLDVAQSPITSITISNLTNGQNYHFTVAAHNEAGLGFPTTAVMAIPNAKDTIPGDPHDLIVTPMNGQVSLTWSAPNNNGGASIDYYIVYQDGVDVLHTDEAEASIIGLANGHTYSFTIAAHNPIGVGSQSAPVIAMPSTTMTAPGSPTGLTVELGNGVIHLSWNVTSNNGGSSVTVYRIYRGLTATTMNAIATTADTRYIDPNIVDDTTYYYGVGAVNAIGEGDMSDVVTIILKSSLEPEPNPSPSFFQTIEGQIAIAGLAIAGIGGIGYIKWRGKRP